MSVILVMAGFLAALVSCEDQIDPVLEEAPPQLVVDAWLNNQLTGQTVRLTRTRPYFNQGQPEGVTGASVIVTDDQGKQFTFIDQNNGSYGWSPFQDNMVLGEVGSTYQLRIELNGVTYSAESTLNPVPTIDSITFRFEEKDFIFPDSYWAEFWSRDLIGVGNTYWIKSYKNGMYLSNPDEINIAFDAGFSEGGNIDGLYFIPPIRDLVNPIDEAPDDTFLSPFADGDSVFVEINSISNEAFIFLNEMALQINRPGGFAELFATPLANVPTNISSSDPNEAVLGFFNVSAVEGLGKRLNTDEVTRTN